MKLNSSQIKSAAVIAFLAGLSPALIAQTPNSGNQSTSPAMRVIPGDTDRDSRAATVQQQQEQQDMQNQRPGHNSNRPYGQAQAGTGTTSGTTTLPGDTDRDSRAVDRPGHNSNTPQHSTSSRSQVNVGGVTATTVPGETDRDSRAVDRPGHNSNTPTVQGSSTGVVFGHGHDHNGHQDHRQVSAASEAELRRGSANELTGMDVKNRSGESLGRVKDFLIDANSGQVVYAVVGSGGIAGIGEKLHPVPVQALNYDTSGNRESLTLDVESSRWSQAPRFSKDRISSLHQDQQGRSIFEYYGQTYRAEGSQASNSQQPARQDQRLVMATDLIGKNIRSGNQNIGNVDDVILQLQSRQAAVLLDPDNDFAGSDQKFVVPINRFTLGENRSLTTTLARSDFSSAQNADRSSWASASQSGQRDALYIWQSDRQSGRRGDSASMSERGAAPIAEVRRAIQSDSSIAANQNDIQVESRGDKLVLRGTVLNEDAKEKIEDRAERAAPGWDIDNQLRVAGAGED